MPHKTEPGFEAAAAAGAAPAQPPYTEVGDMPFWLKEPAAAPPAGAHWKQTVLLWGGSLVALAVIFAGAMWLFDEHNSEREMAVVASSHLLAAPPAPAQPAAPPRRSNPLPPLVLLAPAPAATPAQTSVPVPVAAVPAHIAAVTAPAPALAKASKAPVTRIAAKAPPAKKPLLAKVAPSKALPLAPHKALLAKSAVLPSKAKGKPPASPRKPLVLAKHTPASVPARAKPKALAGVTLPPARERSAEREPPPAQAAAHRCQPGELARECAARD